jgi:tetrahydromethanopterin S-methyltransferase subunit D
MKNVKNLSAALAALVILGIAMLVGFVYLDGTGLGSVSNPITQ